MTEQPDFELEREELIDLTAPQIAVDLGANGTCGKENTYREAMADGLKQAGEAWDQELLTSVSNSTLADCLRKVPGDVPAKAEALARLLESSQKDHDMLAGGEMRWKALAEVLYRELKREDLRNSDLLPEGEQAIILAEGPEYGLTPFTLEETPPWERGLLCERPLP